MISLLLCLLLNVTTDCRHRLIGEITDPRLPEISGLVASREIPGFYYVVNDSPDKGPGTGIYVLDGAGKLVLDFVLEDAVNEDWEAISSGWGPDLYIGDIGDNDFARDRIQVYALNEPLINPWRRMIPKDSYQVWTAYYPDGAHNAEALFVEDMPWPTRLYVITYDDPSQVFSFPVRLQDSVEVELEWVLDLDIAFVTAADMSQDSRHLLLRTENTAYEWQRTEGEDLETMLARAPREIILEEEYQGEAIAYTCCPRRRAPRDFLTTSEGLPAPVHYYHCN